MKPDAVIALTDDVFTWLRRSVPSGRPQPRFIHLAANTTDLAVAGVAQDFPTVGAAAAQMLDSQLRRNERGVPARSTVLTVAGQWQEAPSQGDVLSKGIRT
jgi:hypothetical protein